MKSAKTAFWFARRRRYWGSLASLARVKVFGKSRHDLVKEEAAVWAKSHAVTVAEALVRVGVLKDASTLPPSLPREVLAQGERRAQTAKVAMGGGADLDLIYQSALAIGAKRIVETGVAYGWSSLSALAALRKTDGHLVSVDMPYPQRESETFVGIVIPVDWRDRWSLIREPDRNGIKKAINTFAGEIDLAHYDSDKSYAGRMFAYPILWAALRSGGIFISDDIQDNFGFRDFVSELGLPFAVTEVQGKFTGVIAKPVRGGV